MINKEKVERALAQFGKDLTDKKDSIIEMLESGVSEKELVEKLCVEDDQSFRNLLKELYADIEEEVFRQEVSFEELELVASGNEIDTTKDCTQVYSEDWKTRCTSEWYRSIVNPQFPNCAATVEEGSWCNDSDACWRTAVVYTGMIDCEKAWK